MNALEAMRYLLERPGENVVHYDGVGGFYDVRLSLKPEISLEWRVGGKSNWNDNANLKHDCDYHPGPYVKEEKEDGVIALIDENGEMRREIAKLKKENQDLRHELARVSLKLNNHLLADAILNPVTYGAKP